MIKTLTIAALAMGLGTLASAAPLPHSSQSQQQNQNSSVQITQQPRVESDTGNAATIAWSTNVQAGSKVMYGTNPNQLTESATAPWGGVTHRVYLKNLQPNTTYYYQAVSEHASGSGTTATSNISQFRTSANGQQSANRQRDDDRDRDNQNNRGQNNQRWQSSDNVTIIAGPIVQNANRNSASLWWQTNDTAATRIRYGADPNNMSQTAYEPGGSRDHRVQLSNLQPGRTYYYEILKRYGNVRTTGRFTMPRWNAGTTPMMNGQNGVNGNAMITSGPTIQTIGPNTAVIGWSTQVPASSIVRYGTDPNSLTQTEQAPWGSTNHQVVLNNLQPNTHYYFEVISSQARGANFANSVATNTGQFQTLNQGQRAMNINAQR